MAVRRPWTEEERERARALYEAGEPWERILAAMPGRSQAGISNMASRCGWKRGRTAPLPRGEGAASDVPPDLLRFLRDTPRTLSELSQRFDRSEATVRTWIEALRAAGYNVVETEREVQVSTMAPPKAEPLAQTLLDWPGTELVLALVGDTHIGSLCEQISNLRSFARAAWEAGARVVLHCGDVLAGMGVYRGQAADLYTTDCQEQAEAAREHLPEYDGLTWYVVGGNHDWSVMRRGGPDPLYLLAKMRPDVRHLGYDAVDVPLTDRVDLRLWHPAGAPAYAVSYKLQKGLEAAAYEELQRAIAHQENPRLRLVAAGHLHVSCMLPMGGMVGLQVGCFEGQTNYLKARGRFPEIGGWVLRLRLTDAGQVQGVVGHWFRFTEIVDDWRNYERPRTERVKVEPLFRVEL